MRFSKQYVELCTYYIHGCRIKKIEPTTNNWGVNQKQKTKEYERNKNEIREKIYGNLGKIVGEIVQLRLFWMYKFQVFDFVF